MSGKTTVVGWSSILATWVAIVGGLISIFMAIRAYDRDIDARDELAKRQADEHVAASFRMMERFHEPGFVQIRSDLLEAYDSQGACRLTAPQSALSNQEFLTLVEFFDTAQYCVEAKLCDGKVMAQLLSPYANYWGPMTKPTVLQYRAQEDAFQTDRPLGFGLDALAVRPVQVPKVDCSAPTGARGKPKANAPTADPFPASRDRSIQG